MRKLEIDGELSIILADTVGFINHLPHDLVAAFRATLLETREADLILHVVDCADDNRHEKMQAVDLILEEIGAAEVPQLVIYNKIDLPGYRARVDYDDEGRASRVWLSAISHQGFDELLEVLQHRFSDKKMRCSLALRASEGQVRAFLYTEGAVDSENFENNGDITLNLNLSPALLKKLHRKFQLDNDRIVMLTSTLAGAA